MYFEIEPKSRKQDFFDYDYEYGQVKKALQRKEKIIAVVGVRRVGKTSLLNLVYNETKCLKLWLDGRIVSEPKKELFAAIYETVKIGKPKIFGKIESLNVSAFGVGFGIKLSSESQTEIEKKIRTAGQICVFIDEAQRMKAKELADVLSYFYDRFPQVSFIISGSEIGLVEEILGQTDAEHPLYGRDIAKVVMERLDRNRSAEYLKAGFGQLGMKIHKEEIEDAVAELDGLIGWLTLYGYERGVKRSQNALAKTSQNAARIAASELVHFFKKVKNKKLYISILRNTDGIGWDELRSRTGKTMGEQLNPNQFNFALEKLSAYSFVEKKDQKYHLSDPLLQKAIFLA
ncbi:MAG: ATP-binding protein [Candidatus ainarchaeum sp.]|nr:ATP-binding protein [Candidatus ainarchaeum sp.]